MEIWKDVKGYEGCYQVSSLGRVKSVLRVINRSLNGDAVVSERILKPSTTVYGYHQYGLSLKSKIRSVKAHRLIAEHFIPNPNKYRCINHIDGNKINNNLDNLEWCNHSHNIKHAYDIGLLESTWMGVKVHKPAIKVNQYSLDGKFIRSYDSMSKAYKATGVRTSAISSCASKTSINKTGGGYIWKIAAEQHKTNPQ